MKPIKLVCTDTGQHAQRTLAKAFVRDGNLEISGARLADGKTCMTVSKVRSHGHQPLGKTEAVWRDHDHMADFRTYAFVCPSCSRAPRFERTALETIVTEARQVGYTMVDLSAIG